MDISVNENVPTPYTQMVAYNAFPNQQQQQQQHQQQQQQQTKPGSKNYNAAVAVGAVGAMAAAGGLIYLVSTNTAGFGDVAATVG